MEDSNLMKLSVYADYGSLRISTCKIKDKVLEKRYVETTKQHGELKI